MLPVGALCFYQVHFGRTVLPKWPILGASPFNSVFYNVSELRRACFRQARVARAVLPPGALFRAGALALPPCAPKSHIWGFPHLGFSEFRSLVSFWRPGYQGMKEKQATEILPECQLQGSDEAKQQQEPDVPRVLRDCLSAQAHRLVPVHPAEANHEDQTFTPTPKPRTPY